MILAAICLSANMLVFSQKTRSVITKKEVPKAEFKLTEAAGFSDGNGVYLRWSSESEANILGFYVYRITAKETVLASSSMIPGGYFRSRSTNHYGDYSFFDPNGDLGNSYYIESFGLDGKRQILRQITPNYINDLKAIAGQSSSDLRISAESVETSIEKTELRYPTELQKQFEQNVLPRDLNMQRFVVSQPGAKIGVKSKGFYRVSRTELQNAGFDVNAPSNLWQLYVEGREQAIIVGANDSYIEFYGEGIDTLESDTKVYYLIVGSQNGKRIEPNFLRPLAGNIASRGGQPRFFRRSLALLYDFL
jgi:hypothetical protein